MRLTIVALLSCVTLSGCMGNGLATDSDLTARLAGRTVEYDAPPGLPAERDTFHADGTRTGLFRPLLVPERLGRRTGHWWIEDGRYCQSPSPRGEREGSCYTLTLDGDRIRLYPWRQRSLFQRIVFDLPDIRLPREGRFLD